MTVEFSRGLHEIGDRLWAYLQPDGSWGWSNAGLVVDGDESLVVDTLFDLRLTAQMLADMRRASSAAQRIDTLVNTHANGDHCYGNQLVGDAVIVASRATAAEMAEVPASVLAAMMRNADSMGPVGAFVRHCFGAFDFEGIETVGPTETFEGQVQRRVGDRRVELIDVGPAHTAGDVLVWLPDDAVVFTGDILFVEGTPIMWQGPVQNWIRACDRILEMNATTIVPGHGPITDAAGVSAVRGYLEFVRDEARARYDAGLSIADAARDIDIGAYADWSDAERLGVNVATLYREFGHEGTPPGVVELFGLMAELAGR